MEARVRCNNNKNLVNFRLGESLMDKNLIDKDNMHKRNKEQLYKAILSLNTVEECMDFFEDICTPREIESYVQRFRVAIRVYDGDSYETINIEHNARSNLIYRIKQCLNRESSGLKSVIERLREQGVV